MSIRERLSGNEAVATAMKQINPDVVAAFPITPSTEIPQYFSTFVANGSVDTEFVAVESEHSAMSACIGAEAAGSRAMTATSANGLSLMWEMIYLASSLRLPIVMNLVNRAVSGPLNIHNDHSDAMGVRDSGWIMLFSENNIIQPASRTPIASEWSLCILSGPDTALLTKFITIGSLKLEAM